MTLMNFLVGLPIMFACLIMQVFFAYTGVRLCVRWILKHLSQGVSLFTGMPPVIIAMLIMMFGTLLQVALWGGLFLWLGEFNEVYEAIYHSAVNFASLGYGDVIMSKRWKLLGPLEAINGVLMLGMSAAALISILQQLIKIQLKMLKNEHQ